MLKSSGVCGVSQGPKKFTGSLSKAVSAETEKPACLPWARDKVMFPGAVHCV